MVNRSDVLTYNPEPIKTIIKKSFYVRYGKRILDIFLASLALIIFSPLLFIIAVLVRVKLGSPVLFKQERPGLHEKIFTLYKFRTMTDQKDEKGVLLPDSDRLTKFGKFLRSSSIDELPELWNIVIGNLSIVGPRPLLTEYLPFYTDSERLRHEVCPGLTGLSQIKGRSFLKWEDRFALDVEYVHKCSFLLDCKIVLQTVQFTLMRKDVADAGKVFQDEIGSYLHHQNQIFRRLDEERRTTTHV